MTTTLIPAMTDAEIAQALPAAEKLAQRMGREYGPRSQWACDARSYAQALREVKAKREASNAR